MIDQVNLYPIFEKTTRGEPHAVYRRMRAENPLYRAIGPQTDWPYWFITRYDDCVTVLSDARFGKQFREKLPAELVEARYGPPPPPHWQMMQQNMLFADDPDHARLRRLVHRAFTPRMIESLRGRVHETARDLLDAMGEGGETDLIKAYAFPLPITVIAALLGIPLEERDQFREWTKGLIFSHDEEVVVRTALEFTMYFHEMFDNRRTAPRDDLVSALVTIEEEGDRLNRQELMSMVFLLLVAGHETTVNLIGNGLLELMTHRDQFDLLRAHPDYIGSAVEELLRYNGPIECATQRWALEDVEIDGVVIPQGDIVMAAVIAANRDPAQFPDPDRLDITRSDNRHLAFGHGIHYCLGAPLARLEGAIAIDALIQRFPKLELACDRRDLKWNDSLLLHGMKAMPVRY